MFTYAFGRTALFFFSNLCFILDPDADMRAVFSCIYTACEVRKLGINVNEGPISLWEVQWQKCTLYFIKAKNEVRTVPQ